MNLFRPLKLANPGETEFAAEYGAKFEAAR